MFVVAQYYKDDLGFDKGPFGLRGRTFSKAIMYTQRLEIPGL